MVFKGQQWDKFRLAQYHFFLPCSFSDSLAPYGIYLPRIYRIRLTTNCVTSNITMGKYEVADDLNASCDAYCSLYRHTNVWKQQYA